MENKKQPLASVVVLVTRPQETARELCEQIVTAGGDAIHVPVYEILPPSCTRLLTQITRKLNEFDIAIFVSANAVNRSVEWLKQQDIPWPSTMKVAAVGKSTAKTLNNAGIDIDYVPGRRFDSEGLLALPALNDVAQKKIVIFRGEGGRELLAETLRQRGAFVEYAEVYQRQRPRESLDTLLPVSKRDTVNVIVITSNQGLQNLYDMAGNQYRDWLLNMPLVVISERTAKLAQQIGFKQQAWITAQASNQSILRTIFKWHKQQD